MKSILQTLSKKYGIDFSKTSFSHRECKSSANCDAEDYETANLVGHKDVGYTSCPGANFYAKIPALKKEAAYSVGQKAVDNPRYASYLANKSAQTASSQVSSAPSKDVSKGPVVRILLSYPSQKSVTVEGYSKAPRFGNLAISGTLAKNMALKIEATA